MNAIENNQNDIEAEEVIISWDDLSDDELEARISKCNPYGYC